MWTSMYGDARRIEMVSFDRVVDTLEDQLTNLSLHIHPTTAKVTIPLQRELDFDVHIALTNRDELHLRAAGLKCRWVACGEQGVTEAFIDAVIGIVTGHYRIVLTTLLGKVVACRLQKPDGRCWRTIARQDTQHPGLLWLCRTRIITNKAARGTVKTQPLPRYSPNPSRRGTPRLSRPQDTTPAHPARS